MSILSIVAAVLGLGGVGAALIYYVKKAMGNSIALDEQGASLRLEKEHTAAMQAAADAERAERARSFDAQKGSVRSASDAASLLAGQLTGHT